MRVPSIVRRRRPASIPILLSLALLLTAPGSTRADPPDEVGGSSTMPAGKGLAMDLDALAPDLTLFAGYRVLTESDMSDTYGGLPSLGCELSVGFDDRARFVLGVAYGATSGDPYYDSGTFESGQDTDLKMVPITVGVRLDASDNPRFGLHMGALLEADWVKEGIPDAYAYGVPRDESGWATGLRFTLMPEWHAADRRSAVGLSFEWGGASGEIGTGRYAHEVNLIGLGARLHYTRAL